MADNLATLRAIDEAFDAQVVLLFKVLCDGFRPGDAEADALKRFDAGLDIARRARDAARKRFVD